MGLYSTIGISVSFLSGLWIPATLLCCIPWVQKREYLGTNGMAGDWTDFCYIEMLYLHWVTLFPGKWLNKPERAGFLSTCH